MLVVVFFDLFAIIQFVQFLHNIWKFYAIKYILDAFSKIITVLLYP